MGSTPVTVPVDSPEPVEEGMTVIGTSEGEVDSRLFLGVSLATLDPGWACADVGG